MTQCQQPARLYNVKSLYHLNFSIVIYQGILLATQVVRLHKYTFQFNLTKRKVALPKQHQVAVRHHPVTTVLAHAGCATLAL